MHVASPFAIASPKNEDEMIRPAVEGTLRALRAAKAAGVKRVVLTSSLVAMMGVMKTGTVGPDDWTDVNAANTSTYIKSKTLAERAAWEFIDAQPAEGAMEMVNINPGGVFGPPIGNDITGQTMTSMDMMLRGKMPMVPKLAFPMSDVRDVATLHVRALAQPKAAGERIVAESAEAAGFASVAQILKDQGYKGPSTRIAPNFLVRIMALFDPEAKGMIGFLGMNVGADISKTRKLFDWDPIPLKKSVIDGALAVKSLQD